MLRTLSEYFENAVIETLGFDIETIFDSPELAKPIREVYVDPKGNVARRYSYSAENPDTPGFTRLFVNGMPVDSLPEAVVSNFVLDPAPIKSVFLTDPLIKGDSNLKLTLGFNTVSKTMTIDAAIPGVSEDRVKVSFIKNYLNIHIDEDASVTETTRYLLTEFSDTGLELNKSIFIDTTKFSIEKLRYWVQDGMLRIAIPKKQVAEACLVFKPVKKSTPGKATKRKLEETSSENIISRHELLS